MTLSQNICLPDKSLTATSTPNKILNVLKVFWTLLHKYALTSYQASIIHTCEGIYLRLFKEMDLWIKTLNVVKHAH